VTGDAFVDMANVVQMQGEQLTLLAGVCNTVGSGAYAGHQEQGHADDN
jgi:hypothetical protein